MCLKIREHGPEIKRLSLDSPHGCMAGIFDYFIIGYIIDMYYILELEISVEFKSLLDAAAERENLTLEEFIVRSFADFLKDTEKVKKLKAEYDALPEKQKVNDDDIRVVRMFPVYAGESEDEARALAILKEKERYTPMSEVSVSEFREHIEEDDFPLRYGNPVVINNDNGKKLVCLSWEFYERLMNLSGRSDELDKINRQIADKSVD